jgi:hypothetical protein
MAEKEPGRAQRSSRAPTTPTDYPVTPSSISGLDHSFVSQAIMEVQRSVGQLTQATTTLAEDSKDHRKQLGRISHIMYAIGVVGAILLGILVFLANKIADPVVAGIKPH